MPGLLNRLAELMPYLFLAGALAALFLARDLVLAAGLALFAVFHAAALLLVLPEMKHAGQLLLPITVLGSSGMWLVGKLVLSSKFRTEALGRARARLKGAAWATGIATLGWGAACTTAYAVSVRERADCLEAVRLLAAEGVPAPEAIRDSRLFAVRFDSQEPGHPVGYLLEIRAGSSPGLLVCTHGWGAHPSLPGRILKTRHQLHPDQVQHFVVSCPRGAGAADPRRYLCTVALDGAAAIMRCTRLDLTYWRRPPLCTVFVEHEQGAGSPAVGAMAAETCYEGPSLP
jgi:hypothetical protein